MQTDRLQSFIDIGTDDKEATGFVDAIFSKRLTYDSYIDITRLALCTFRL
jgi:hypothetical protein